MEGRRAESRKVMMARVELLWDDPSGASCTAAAMIEDRSLGGAGIYLGKAIAAGTRVQVKTSRQHFWGTVRHCGPVKGRTGFTVGIQFDPEARPEPPPQPSPAP
jgi:hypothetical protein